MSYCWDPLLFYSSHAQLFPTRTRGFGWLCSYPSNIKPHIDLNVIYLMSHMIYKLTMLAITEKWMHDLNIKYRNIVLQLLNYFQFKHTELRSRYRILSNDNHFICWHLAVTRDRTIFPVNTNYHINPRKQIWHECFNESFNKDCTSSCESTFFGKKENSF